MAKKAPDTTLIDVLNDLRATELAAIVQYMRHHYLVTGAEGLALADEFKSVSIEEMKHAEALAERIDFLGGNPTTKPTAILTDATTLKAMATEDLAYEDEAVKAYRGAIVVAADLGDVTTRRLLEDILADEEAHQDTFGKMLGK